MTGPDNSNTSGGSDRDAGYVADSAGGVTTVSPSSSFPAATPFSDDSPNSPYGSSSTSTGSSSTWTGSPYEPLPTDSKAGELSTSSYGGYSSYDDGASSPTYIAPPPSAEDARSTAPANGKQTKSRAVAGLVSAVLGPLLVGGGLYLIGEFGFRIFDVMLNVGGQPATWDIVWTSTGAALIFVAVLLNGWSPWATLLPGLLLTARRHLVDRLVRRRRPGRHLDRPDLRPPGDGRVGHHRLDAGPRPDPGRRQRRGRSSPGPRADDAPGSDRPSFPNSGADRKVSPASNTAVSSGSITASARPRCDSTSFSAGLSSADVRPSPAASLSAGTNTGS